MDDRIKSGREFLKANWQLLEGYKSDQQLKLPAPELQLAYPDGTQLIDLPSPDSFGLGSVSLIDAINQRASHRVFDIEKGLDPEELAYLLWVTQGIKQVAPSGKATLRTVPSGGARHTFETYLAIRRVSGLEPGIYRYLALEHKLIYTGKPADFDEAVREACMGQKCAGQAAVVFIWASFPERAEWRYGPVSHKMIAIDAGHVCQNLYLACEAIGCGTVAVGAYDQQRLDALVGADGVNQITVYAAPVGKLKS